MTKILIVTNGLKFSRILDYSLTTYGFTVETASTYDEAYKLLEEINFKIVLVDLPYCEDFFLRAAYPCPVIAMAEHFEEVEVLSKIYHGVDDYILKPFGMPELRMIMNKQLQRRQLMIKPLVMGDMKIDVARNVLMIKDQMISLGKHELEIMIKLTRQAGKIVTADALMTKQRIYALKKKLQDAAGSAFEIKSISGLGYKLIAPAI